MSYKIKGNTGEWELVVGCEVHAQIASESKLFSGAATSFGAEPNSQVSLVDAAMPGMLPVLNKKCIEQAVRTGLGLNAKINLRSVFDRKNYFYADLPQGYQISQYSDPVVGEGTIYLDMQDGTTREIGIERIHVEQDAGKSLHDQSPTSTFVDLNRAGVGLMEIVSKPDMRSPEEAGEFVRKLRSILRYLGTSDGDMEKGNMRCDANVSVRKAGEKFGTRCEIKNLNSMRNIINAIIYEANRQVEIIEGGGVIKQETRLYDANANETRTMRSKEDAHDYRYFPDPDLYPLVLEQSWVDEIKKSLPELPDQKKEKYIKTFGLSSYDASVIVAAKETAKYYDSSTATAITEFASLSGDPSEDTKKEIAKRNANWLTTELSGRLNKLGVPIENSPVTEENLGKLVGLISSNIISGKIAKDVLDIMVETGQSPEKIVEEKGLKQVTDTGAIEKIIDEVIAANADKVAEYRSGKDKLFGFFVGQVMKVSGGKANPAAVNELLKKKLDI